jgi:hypothetical protein
MITAAATHAHPPTPTSHQNQKGDPVVTKMAVVFSLPAAVAPHLRLPAWQWSLAASAGAAALSALQSGGWAAAVAEDAWTAAAASWRAGTALGAPAIEGAAGPAAEALKRAAAAGWKAAKARAAAKWGFEGGLVGAEGKQQQQQRQQQERSRVELVDEVGGAR